MKRLTWLLALVALPALATDVTVSWTNPTTNTDGSTIPASGAGSLTQTRVEYGSCSGAAFGVKTGEVTASAPATSSPVTGLAAASTYCFRAFAKNTYGSESAASNVVAKTLAAPVPMPPTLSSTVTVAWDLRNGKLWRVVGNIPLGTPCGAYVTKEGQKRYYEVARSYVTLTRQPRSTRLVTRCAVT